MFVIGLVLGLGMLGLLFLRAVQPEVIYAWREQVVAVCVNRAFLDREAGRNVPTGLMPRLLIKDFRHATRLHDENYVLNRLLKLRELYRLQGSQLHKMHSGGSSRDTGGLIVQPQICIRELAGLLDNLSRQITPSMTYSRPTLEAVAILKFIGDAVRQMDGEPPLTTEKEVEAWFRDQPISIEQVAEILIAGAFGLAFRQTEEIAQARSAPLLRPDGDLKHELHTVEQRFRALLRRRLEAAGDGSAAEARLKSGLGHRYTGVLNRMRQAREEGPASDIDVVGFMSFDELRHMISVEWEFFGPLLGDHDLSWIDERLLKLVRVRNALAHGRRPQQANARLAREYIAEIMALLAKSDISSSR